MTGSLLNASKWTGKALAGEWTTLSGGQFEVLEPATAQPIGRVARAAPEDVRASAADARRAQRGWYARP